MVTQRTDDTDPGVCPPLPRTGLRLGRSLERLGADPRRRQHAAFGAHRQEAATAGTFTRAVASPSQMTTLFHDIRLALRLLRRRPGFSATAVLTLAIGIGVNAVAFSVVNGLLFKGIRHEGSARGRPHCDNAGRRRNRLRVARGIRPLRGRGARSPRHRPPKAALRGLAARRATETAWVPSSHATTSPWSRRARCGPAAGRASPRWIAIGRRRRAVLATEARLPFARRIDGGLNNTDVSVAGVIPGHSLVLPVYSPTCGCRSTNSSLFATSQAAEARHAMAVPAGQGEEAPGLAQVQGRLSAAARTDGPGVARRLTRRAACVSEC